MYQSIRKKPATEITEATGQLPLLPDPPPRRASIAGAFEVFPNKRTCMLPNILPAGGVATYKTAGEKMDVLLYNELSINNHKPDLLIRGDVLKHIRFFASAVLWAMLLTLTACSSDPDPADTPESTAQFSGQIYLYGEQHGVEKIKEKELAVWCDCYNNEGMRHLLSCNIIRPNL